MGPFFDPLWSDDDRPSLACQLRRKYYRLLERIPMQSKRGKDVAKRLQEVFL